MGQVKTNRKYVRLKSDNFEVKMLMKMLMANLRGAMKSREERLERTPSRATTGRDSMLYRGSLLMIIREK